MRTKQAFKTGAVALLTAVTLWPAAASATTTRVYTLGAMNRFIVDDSNRWLYPHMITKFGNLFYVELFGGSPSQTTSAPGSNRQAAANGNTNVAVHSLDIADTLPIQQSAGGGAIIAITDDLFVSMHLSDYEDPTVPQFLGFLAGSSQGDPSTFGWIPNAAPDAPASSNRKYDLFLAYNVQDLARFGLQLSYGSSKYKRTPNDNDPDVPADLQGGVENRKTDSIGVSDFGFLLGAGLDLGDSATIDVGLGMNFYSLGYSPNERDDLIEGGGGYSLQADVRAIIGVSEMWEVVPALSFRMGKMTAADLANYGNGLIYNEDDTREKYFITDVSQSRLLFDLGAAGHFKPTENISFWGGAGFHLINLAQEYENGIADAPDSGEVRDQALEFSKQSLSIDALPYIRIAMEARIFSWLDFRAGVVKYLRADTVTEDAVDENNSDNNRLNDVTRDFPFFDYFIGAAVHYEGFFCDLQLDPRWFQRGPELISGGGGGNPMFVNASLGYNF